MKRRLFVLFALAAFVGAACGGSDDPDPAAEPDSAASETSTEDDHWDYVALGGSIASGAGTAYGTSYVDHYEELVEEDTGHEVDILDLAIGEGGTVPAVLDLLAEDSTVKALEGAEIVTMEIGGNDLAAGDEAYFAGECDGLDCYRELEETFETDYETLVNQIHELTGDDAILRSVTFYNPLVGGDGSYGGPGFAKVAGRVTEMTNAATCEISESAGWVCVDIYPAFNGADGAESPIEKGLIAGDMTHPSDEGHELIASLIQGAGYAPLE